LLLLEQSNAWSCSEFSLPCIYVSRCAAVLPIGIMCRQIGTGKRLWKWAAAALQLPEQYDLPVTDEASVASLLVPPRLHEA